ncbi:MAG: DASS family sodium-coupled anion symporter [Myxococcota bacterium]
MSQPQHAEAPAIRPLRAALGAALFFGLWLLDTPLRDASGADGRAALAAALTACMAFWWIAEALPMYWTACLPLVVIPLSTIHGEGFAANASAAVLPYLDPYVFLFLGGMGIAAAMQQWKLHRRIALSIMSAVGTEPRRLLLGMLLATAFVSLWISNTATAAMMFPIGLAILAEFEHQSGRRLAGYGAALMLAIAYAANLGGTGTKIGTVPSAQLSGFLAQRGEEVAFLDFMLLGVPFAGVFLLVVWAALWRMGRADAPADGAGLHALEAERARLGAMQRAEWVVLAVFLAAALLWMFGHPITAALRARGLPASTALVEATVAITASLLLMAIRVGGRAVLEPASLRGLQWKTLLLIGGGFSMAEAISGSGLSDWLGTHIAGLRHVAPLPQLVLVSLTTVALSAFASNAATIAVLLPILATTVAPAQIDPILFAATFAASCDFALPAGTPPNAIVFGSGYVSIPQMARTGVVLDGLAAVWAALWCGLMVPLVR